ncbi:MAG: hypothetical protein WCQ66_10400, partial [Sphaerochaetaceae bacterium]
ELKMITSTNRSPKVVALSNLWTKMSLKYVAPFFLMTSVRVRIPATRGMTTKRKTLAKSVR